MASDRIKGITVEIGGDTQGLNKAIKATNSEIKSTQNELKQVDRLLKLDPTNIDLLRQRQDLLKKSVGETQTKLDALKKAKEQADKDMAAGTQVNQEEYRRLEREIVATEQSLTDLKKQAAESNAVLSQIGAVADGVADKANKVADATKGISAAAAGALAGIGGMAYKAMTLSDDLNTLAKQSGFSTEELQKMQYAADRIDVSMETITGAAAKLKKNMVSDSADTVAAFDQLGVSVRDSNGELRDSTDVFFETVEALSHIENETERDTMAMQLFGKSADQLAGIIDDGGAALNELGQEAEDLGLIIDQQTLDSLNSMNDQVDKLKAQSLATLATSGAKAAEVLMPIFEQVVEKIGALLEWIGTLDEDTIKMILTVLAVVAAISPIAGIIGKVAGAISALMPILSTIFSALGTLISTIGIIPIAIAAVIAAIAIFGDDIQRILGNVDQFLQGVFAKDWSESFGLMGTVLNGFMDTVKSIWDAIKLIFDGIIDFVRGVFTGDWERAWKGVQEIFGGIFDGLIALAKAPLNAIISLLNGAISGLNDLIDGLNDMSFDVPDWVPKLGGKSFSLNIPNIPKIPMLASGGIVTNGNSAVVGEAGAELLTVQGGKAIVQPLGRQMPTITMNNVFNGYDSATGAAAARDLAAQINRALGGVY